MTETINPGTYDYEEDTEDLRQRSRLRIENVLSENNIDIHLSLFENKDMMISKWDSELRKKNICFTDGHLPKPSDFNNKKKDIDIRVLEHPYSDDDENQTNDWTSTSKIIIGDKAFINRGLSISRIIETGVYNYIIEQANNQCIDCSWENNDFILMYRDKILEVLFALGQNDNEYHRSVMNGYASPDDRTKPANLGEIDYTESSKWKKELKSYLNSLASRDVYNMAPWWYYTKDEEDERNAEELRKKELESACTLFTCGRCKANKTWCSAEQRRSADEPMTILITCIKCGLSWKKN
jgi:DNA-directed RNA polymerase subunit M/transcription elongation factor TFIIS